MGVIYIDPSGKYFNGDVKVATQPLAFSECTPETQIRFQFGTLDSAQAAFFQQNPSILARSVRTSYNPGTLQAQGFLYISPQVGELVNSIGGPSGEVLLQHFLSHELGHVFGIKHLDQQDDNIMSTEHLSSLFRKIKYGKTKWTLSPEPIFEFQNATSNVRGESVCEDVAWGRPDILKVLDPTGDLRCLGFPQTKSDAKTFLMHGRSPQDTGDRVVRKITVGNELTTTENTLVGVHVTAAAEQVYPGVKDFLGNWPSLRLRGGILRTKGWEGVYTDSTQQVSKPLIVIANRNQSVLVVGALEGKPVSNLELYSSPTAPKKAQKK